jgi:hypothetical protein
MKERVLYFILGTLSGWAISTILPPGRFEVVVPPARVTVVRVIEEKLVVSDVYQGGVTIVNEVAPTPVTISSPVVNLGATSVEAKFPAIKIVLAPDGGVIERDHEADRVREGMERFRQSMGLDAKGEMLPPPKGE